MCEIELARNLDIQNVSDMMAIAREVRGLNVNGLYSEITVREKTRRHELKPNPTVHSIGR